MAWQCQRDDSEVTKWHWYSARETALGQRPTTGTIGFLRRFFGLFSSAEQPCFRKTPPLGAWRITRRQAVALPARMNAFGKQKAKAPRTASEGRREAQSQGQHLQTRLRGQRSVREESDTLLYSSSGSRTPLPSPLLPPGRISGILADNHDIGLHFSFPLFGYTLLLCTKLALASAPFPAGNYRF